MPVGIAFSTLCLQCEFKLSTEKERRILAYATCLVAFAESYLTPESDWETSLLNKITVEGYEHYMKAVHEREGQGGGGDQAELEELNEKYIDTTLVICRNNFDLELFQPFIIGQLLSNDPSIPSLKYGCKRFFRKHKYCLLSVDRLYFLIWKRYGLYFLFDPNNRNTNLKLDAEHGYNVTMAMPSLHNINCLITNLSGLRPNDIYTIRRIKVKMLLPFIPTNTIYKRIRKMEFDVVDNQHALLKGHVNLEMPQFAEVCGKMDSVIAIIAIVMSKIDLPSTWDGYVIDEIIILSSSKYKEWNKQSGTKQLNIQNIPTAIKLGIFNVKFILLHCDMCGTWSYVPNYRFSRLTVALKKILPDSSNIIIEIAGRFYPLWKRNEYFYLLDVYQHGCTLSPAVVHMCSTINSLCCVLHYNVLELLTPSDFIIHKVIVIEILRKNQCKVDLDEFKMIYEPKVEESMSLNESIEDIQWTVDFNLRDDYCQEEFQNLDGDGLSMTQIPPNYQSQKNSLGEVESEYDEDEGDEEDEEEEEEQESDSDLETSGAGFGALGPKQKGGKGKGGKGKGGKGQAKKGKKGKSKKEDGDDSDDGKEKKGKNKKGKDKEKGKKDKKEKEPKEKKVKEPKEKKVKEPKEKKVKEPKEKKVKEPKEKKEKEPKEKKEKEPKEKKEKEPKEKKEKEAKEKKEKEAKDKKEKEAKDKKVKGSRDKEDKANKDKDRDIRTKGEGDQKSKGKDQGDTGTGKGGKDDRAFGRGDKDSYTTAKDRDKADEDRERFSLSLTNSYPGYSCIPYNIAVVGSESGSPESIINLLQIGLKITDRVLLMSPWGNFVIFQYGDAYLLYDGCTCDVERFRHLDLTKGTAGLIVHDSLNAVVGQITSNQVEVETTLQDEHLINEIIEEYGR